MTKLRRSLLCSLLFGAVKIKYEKHGKFASIYPIPERPTSTFWKFPEHSTEKYSNFRIDLYTSFLIFGPIIFGHEKLAYCCYFINKTTTKVTRKLKLLAYNLDTIGGIVIAIYGHLLM